MSGLVTETRAECIGNEAFIAGKLVLTKEQRDGVHTGCPRCGGADRFRFKLNHTRGARWWCNQCNPQGGDIIDLVQAVEDLPDITTAALRTREILGLPSRVNGAMTEEDRKARDRRREELRAKAAEADAKAAAEDAVDIEKKLKAARWLWQGRRQFVGSPAARYWRARGLSIDPMENIEFLAGGRDLPHAMVAAFAELDPDGFPLTARAENIRGIHRTFLNADGSSKADMPDPKQILGREQSLPVVVAMGGEENATLVIAEGIEDAATAAQASDFAAWAAGVANRMPGLAEHIPHWVRRVIIVEDDDRERVIAGKKVPGAGPEAAAKLASILSAKGIDVLIERGGDKVETPKGLRRRDLNQELKENGPEAVLDRLARAIPFTTSGIGGEPDATQRNAEHKVRNTMKDVPQPFPDCNQKARPELKVVVTGDDDHNMRDGRPVIRIQAGELHSMATLAQEILVRAGVEVFVRGDELVVPASRVAINARGEQIQAPFLGTVSADAMRDLLSEYIAWEKWDERKKAWVVAHPPKDVVDTIMSRRGRWKFAHIAGIIGTPTLRYDGSLLSEEGYDKKTALYVMNAAKVGSMPDKPTREDAMAAIDLLKGEVLADFPFVTQEGETLERNAALSVALSILITPVVRGCMNVAPMHAVTAPTKGSGKSMLFDSSAMISLGTTCPAISVGKKDDETEKRISSEALAGAPIINIDNVNGTLGGDQLCQLVTQEICKIRILGRSETPSIMNRFCMFANGNNILLTEDMTRRAVLCGLDAGLENPSERDFQGRNPVKAIGRDRGRYIAACLTIVRAYILAGRPDVGCPSWGSFEDWTKSVRGALIWCGEADPYETTKIVQADDPHAAKIACMFTGMKQAGVITEYNMRTVKQLWEEAQRTHLVGDGEFQNPDLQDALALFRTANGFNASAAGLHMRSLLNKVMGGYKLCSKPNRNKVMCWYLQPL